MTVLGKRQYDGNGEYNTGEMTVTVNVDKNYIHDVAHGHFWSFYFLRERGYILLSHSYIRNSSNS